MKPVNINGQLILNSSKHGEIVFDPFCGSGTILIEGAMKALNIAPGIRRVFAAEGGRAGAQAR